MSVGEMTHNYVLEIMLNYPDIFEKIHGSLINGNQPLYQGLQRLRNAFSTVHSI